uniref:Uncharacterized protein n=1 Tax=Arundo donax TaxID=35708 RepID=A0A0A9HMM4_ARUDO
MPSHNHATALLSSHKHSPCTLLLSLRSLTGVFPAVRIDGACAPALRSMGGESSEKISARTEFRALGTA